MTRASPATVPVANPGAGYATLRAEINAAVARVLSSGWYVLGQEGRAFETEFAAWLGTPHAIGCGNGTDALALVLRALGVGPGSAVVTVSHTAVATVAAIEMAGATPLLIDIDPTHYTMDPTELAAVLKSPPPGLPPVRAVIPVHLYGQAADLGAIRAVCMAHDIAMIEDCSQAHGATLYDRKLGTFGVAACFSCYPTKNLGALGDAGIIATEDATLAERLRALRQYGWTSHYVSDKAGVNSRLDELQAAILRVKLAHLDTQNARRAAIAAAYDAVLAGGQIAPPARRPDGTHVFHLYVVRARDRTDVQTRLRENGIGTGIHYPLPVHLQPAYRGQVAMGPSTCHHSAEAAQCVLSLPIWPEMADTQVEKVCAALRAL